MTFSGLDSSTIKRLKSLPFTYEEVGGTTSDLPAGYHHVRERELLTTTDLDGVAARLMNWQMHERAGFSVAASDPAAEVGTVVILRRRVGLVTIAAACRVVYVIDEPARRGFAYGTLAGHPESGEEAFVIERSADGSLTATITGFSRPAALLARTAGPLGRRLQAKATSGYLKALSD